MFNCVSKNKQKQTINNQINKSIPAEDAISTNDTVTITTTMVFTAVYELAKQTPFV